VPALILSGELDNITTVADGAAVARAFKHGVQIKIANSFHVNALPHARSACGAQIVRRFIDTLSTGDTACAGAVPPLRLVPRFALHAEQLSPATPAAGNRATAAQLQQVNAAVMTAGDVLVRVGANSSGQGVGLRGGAFRIVHDSPAVHITLDRVRWTEDVAVSGEIDRSAARGGGVRAKLQVTTTNGQNGEFSVEWPEDVAGSSAVIRGALNGAQVQARTAAP